MSDTVPATTDTMIAALLRERDAYARRGMDDRVAQVDAQLRLRGHTPPGDRSTGDPDKTPPTPDADNQGEVTQTPAGEQPPKEPDDERGEEGPDAASRPEETPPRARRGRPRQSAG